MKIRILKFIALILLMGTTLNSQGQSTSLSSDAQTALSIAEEIYPNLFNGGGSILSAQGYLYRFYRLTGVYVGFKNNTVYVVGGPFGPAIQDKGSEAALVSFLQSEKQRIEQTTLPSLPGNATLSGLREASCSEEGTIKSISNTSSSSVKIFNSTSSRIKFYWLDYAGKRKEYATVNAGANYTQASFVTHPWLIANEQDACLGIYVPMSTGTTTITMSKSLPGATGDANADRVTRGIQCLIAKKDTVYVTAIQGLLNVYLQAKPLYGATIAYQGYLASAVEQLNRLGC